MLDRLRRNVQGAVMLARAGADPWSIALYPLRRRIGRRRTQLDLHGGTSVLGPPDEPLLFLFKEIWVERRYDPGPPALRHDGAIIDIGAHVGLFTLWALSMAGDVPVVAIEPSPRVAAYLRENVKRNGLRSVNVMQAACGGTRRRALLYAGRSEMQSTLHPSAASGAKTQEVDVVTLDDVFAQYTIEHCQLLKVDCEGAEYEILQSASPGVLARIDRIVMECHMDREPGGPERLAAHLTAQGFELRWERSDAVHSYVYARRAAAPVLLPLDVAVAPQGAETTSQPG